jgi:hypothetical protein
MYAVTLTLSLPFATAIYDSALYRALLGSIVIHINEKTGFRSP